MKIRTAIPILAASAAVMLAGLGIANAQDQPQRRPRLPGRTPQVNPSLQQARKAIQQAQQRKAQQRGAQKNQGGDQGGGGGGNQPAGPAAPGGGDEGRPPAFETGVDYEPMSPRARVTFNLEDADLPDLVRLISNITGKRFILPSKTRNLQATVYAPSKVTVAEAYRAFLSILEVNGMTVVPSGRYLKIVESSGIQQQPVPTYGAGSASPGDDRFITRMHRVQNISAEDVSELLGRFSSREGSITAYQPTNMIIITDTGANIRRMLRLVEAIDVPRGGEQIWIEPIHYANAVELAEKLAEIFEVGESGGGGGGGGNQSAAQRRAARRRAARRNRGGDDGGGGGGAVTVGSAGESRITKIIPEERTNSLIILATERAYLRILELIRQLDVPIEGEGRIHVHPIQHLDATELASTLESLIEGGGGSQQGQRGGGQGGGGGGSPVAALFEGAVRVTAHEASNSLVVTASLHDYAALRRVIDELDSPRRQVFIEAVIMELSVSRSSELGLSFHGGAADVPTDGSLTVLGFEAANSLNPLNQDALTGLAVGVRGQTIPESQQLVGLSIPAFGVVLNAIARSGDANVLSTPHIIAMDNTEAEISVGQNIPLQTNQSLGGLGGLSGLGGLGGLLGQQGQQTQGAAGLAGLAGLSGGLGAGVARQDVGTTIRITPHINDNNEIRMEIEEEISERGATEGDLGVVSINRRTATTELMVRDQQTVVIGGLMRDSVNTSETKIPVLGDIPLLGALFRQTRKEKQKSNLLLFLTPYIIRDPSDLRAIFERKMRERQEFLDRYFVFGDQDYSPPIDYSRTRGLLGEMINEVDDIQEERDLIEAAQNEPPPEHVPRAPVGSAAEMGVDRGGGDDGEVVVEPEDGGDDGGGGGGGGGGESPSPRSPRSPTGGGGDDQQQ